MLRIASISQVLVAVLSICISDCDLDNRTGEGVISQSPMGTKSSGTL